MTLKNRLKELRAREKMSQQELADKSGVSRQMISLIERGKVEPSIVVALKLVCLVYNVVPFPFG